MAAFFALAMSSATGTVAISFSRTSGKAQIRRLAEPDVLVDMTGFRVLDGNRPAMDLDAEIADTSLGRKLGRLQAEDSVQDGVDFGREERLVHHRRRAELERLAFTRGIIFAGDHHDFCLRVCLHQLGKGRIAVQSRHVDVEEHHIERLGVCIV